MTILVSEAARFLLQAAATAQDTVIVRQVPPVQTWFEQVVSVASGISTILVLLLVTGLVMAMLAVRRSVQKAHEALDKRVADFGRRMDEFNDLLGKVHHRTEAIVDLGGMAIDAVKRKAESRARAHETTEVTHVLRLQRRMRRAMTHTTMTPSRRISIPATLPSKVGMKTLWLVLGAMTLLALIPTTAWAWTPGTHILLGEAVLRSAALLPPAIAALLRAHPHDFLYGSIAADTSIAKKYAKFGRHCHSWPVGLEILDQARDEPVRAFAYGYLAHLAADAVAHNYFVPHQLAVTTSTSALGHSYWESRFETHIGEVFPRRAHEIILLDHARSDEHLDRILSPTIFSTPTNRRIFRGMVYVTDTESWQRIFLLMAENSRWDLEEREVGRYLTRSFDFIMDFLARDAKSEPYQLDPSGDRALREAKSVRKSALRIGGDDRVRVAATREFGMPESALAFARALRSPLYVPALAPRS